MRPETLEIDRKTKYKSASPDFLLLTFLKACKWPNSLTNTHITL